ncbi:putative zinc finger in N-recognin-domain-containing protein [Scheffersomyces amazonensis]|uniref:putative zinc finger in N-recognin-domain-containing protein n=1 Tax=Scheffersomyces amazonensis TaxID=1078765 RepID=UPI00315CA454
MSTTKSEESITAVDYIHNQEELEKEARQLMPFEPDECTYIKGELRQPVFACLTCSKQNNNTPIGICYSCSIQCHSTHELVELFSKRNFVCDCGTERMKNTVNGACKLRSSITNEKPRSRSSSGVFKRSLELPADDIPASSNEYNQNYQGLFCSCKKTYNPLEESGNMIQCYFGFVCGEEWYHEECILGYKAGTFKSQTSKNHGINILDKLPPPAEDAETEQSFTEDNSSDDVKVPYFPNLETFDSFICWKCVSKFDSVFKELVTDKDIVIAIRPHFDHILNVDEWKRKYQQFELEHSKQDNETSSKRIKLEDKVEHHTREDIPYSVFLNFEFRTKLNQLMEILNPDTKVYQFLINNDYLYKDDPVYEPPEEVSDDEGSSTTGSLLDLGSEALSSLPREQAIEGLQAYDKIRSKLRDFFKPFAEQGKIVTEEEVRDFFAKVKEE